MMDELFFGQRRIAVIAVRQSVSANPDLSGHAGGQYVHILVQDVNAAVGNGLADGDGMGIAVRAFHRVPGGVGGVFGGPVHVVKHARKRLPGSQQTFRGCDFSPLQQVFQVCHERGTSFGHPVEQCSGEENDRYVCLEDEIRQVFKGVQLFRIYRDSAAIEQPAPYFKCCGIKTDGRGMQEDQVIGEIHIVGVPDQAEHAFVRHNHGLGRAAGARGEIQVSGGFRGDVRKATGRVRAFRCDQHLIGQYCRDAVGFQLARVQVCFGGNQGPYPGGIQDHADPFYRIVRINGGVRTAGFQNAQEADDGQIATGQHGADRFSRLYPLFDQPCGQDVGLPVQFPVGHGFLVENDRGLVWIPGGCFPEYCRNGYGRIVRAGIVPCVQNGVPFRIRQHGDVLDCHRRVFHGMGQDIEIMGCHPVNHRMIIAFIFPIQVQGVGGHAGIRSHLEHQVGTCERGGQFITDHRQVRPGEFRVREIPHMEDGGEQRVVWTGVPFSHFRCKFRQRNIPVGGNIHELFSHSFAQRGK